MSVLCSACLPPFTIFSIGIGSNHSLLLSQRRLGSNKFAGFAPSGPLDPLLSSAPFVIQDSDPGSKDLSANRPKYLYNGIFSSSAAAFATAIDTAKIAFAPNLDLFPVPSSSIIFRSIARCRLTSIPTISRAISSFTLATALVSPIPPYLLASLSRNSNASCDPVEAPLGTDALPLTPDSKITSASTVGFPRESSICLPCTDLIFISLILLYASENSSLSRDGVMMSLPVLLSCYRPLGLPKAPR